MKRYRVRLRDGSSLILRGAELATTHQRSPYDRGHPVITDETGETVFVGSFREVAYVAEMAAEEPEAVQSEDHTAAVSHGPSRWLDVGSKIVAMISSLAVVAFVILVALGRSKIGAIQTESLLTVFGFTFIGGIISMGGVQLFTLNASLRRAQASLEHVERSERDASSIIRVLREFRISFTADDPDTISALDQARDSRSRQANYYDYNLSELYLDILLEDDKFRDAITREAELRRMEGWSATGLVPNDTINNGLIVNLVCEKVL